MWTPASQPTPFTYPTGGSLITSGSQSMDFLATAGAACDTYAH